MIKSRLKILLAERDMTLKSLQAATGIRPGTLTKLKAGTMERLHMDVFNAICRELHCQPGDLFEYVPDEPEQPTK